VLLLFSDLCKALAAIDRTIRLRLKGNSGLATAHSAGSSEVLTGSTGRSLTGIPTRLAALRLILEAPLSIEFLLASGEHKFLTAFFAN
jgi:hypothetical protein